MIKGGHFDNQKHNFNFGQKNAYHKVFIPENCKICIFFMNQNKNLRHVIFFWLQTVILFFGCKLVFVLKYKLKKNCMQKLTFCVCNIVQDEFFT